MIKLLITGVLLLGNGFFVGSEFALIASRRTVLEPRAETSRRARMALRAMSEIPLMIAGAQLGITICTLGLGAIAEPALAHYLEAPFHLVGVPDAALHPIAFVLALAIVSYLHTVIGEMVPKNLALAGPESVVVWLGPLLYWFCLATKPLLQALKWLSKVILRIWRIESTDAVKTVFTAEELAGLVSQARTEGLLDASEHARITGALALNNSTALDVMRPWASVTTVTADVSPASLEVLATRTGWSRFPVVERATRRVLGFVHVKDILGIVGAQRREPIPPELIRPLPVVAGDRTLAELLLAMRKERRHMMLVSDARTPLGVVTLDDVLMAVVGTPSVST
ncbi:hemolysin family protein [Virgisporangium ochraceum]|jgi:CBS domain containing-hemolysin-like protein|uniref:Membrane protein n=1 Tax=Virgisporangium ochraceum TaxID=65505 RepID=A0A8J4E9I7_9ACTN|nr:hemolysin family protein [Virgisporangium ochraceum]GIJ66358.1 membrane protein [Virgisporangium ochraceum]